LSVAISRALAQVGWAALTMLDAVSSTTIASMLLGVILR